MRVVSLLKPWLLHTWAFRRGCVGFRHKLLLCPSSLAGPVSFEASSPAVESTLGGPGAVCFVSVFHFPNALFPFTHGGGFSALLKPSLLHTLASRRGVFGRYSCYED